MGSAMKESWAPGARDGVQAGRTSEASVRSQDRQIWCRYHQAFSELAEKTP